MPQSFQEIIRLIANGDPVDATSINTILRQLAGNAEYLKLLLDEALLGSVVMAREVTVKDTVSVGQPVYFNTTNQRFEPALASAYVDGTTGQLTTADSTQVIGVCYYKHNSTNADILLHGYASLDVSAAITGTDAGLYYLSGANAGKLVLQKPPVTVPVLFWDGVDKVYVNPNFNNAFLTHQHYKFTLLSAPAGGYAVPLDGSSVGLQDYDTSKEGWIPANDAVFGGSAPAGAKFGYNLSASNLNNIWPPLPINSSTLSWTRPNSLDAQSTQLPTQIKFHDTTAISGYTISANSTDTVTVALPGNPGISTGYPRIGNSLYTSEGLLVGSVTFSSTDNLDVVLTNPTDEEVTINGTLHLFVYDSDTDSRAVVDFREDTVPDELVVIDSNGIWWMSDCYNSLPFPPTYGAPAADLTTEDAIVVTGFEVSRSDTAGSNPAAVLYGEGGYLSTDVAIDSNEWGYAAVGTKIVSFNTNRIQEYGQLLYDAGTTVYGLDLDEANGYIYFTTATTIQRIDTDGSNHTNIRTGLTAAKGIRLDGTNDVLYFVDSTKICKCTAAGGAPSDVVTGLTTPGYLALDVSGDKMYWTDSGTSKIQRSTLAGASITDLVTSTDAVGIDITGSAIYFTVDNLVRTCTLAGASVTTVRTLDTIDTLSNLRAKTLTQLNSIECLDEIQHLVLWFTKMQFQTAETVVTSLSAAEGSGLTITCLNSDNTTGTTGDLKIDFDPEFLVDDGDDEEGYLVFKRYADKKFYRGPVVEGLIIDSNYISASSTAEDDGTHQGVVTLSFTPTPVGGELPIDSVRLNNVTEENYEDVLGLGFPEGVDAEYRARVTIPANMEGTTVGIKLRFVVLARAAGSIPALTLTARTVPRPGQTTGTSLALPTADASVTLSVASATSMVEDNYVELESAQIDTTPGAFVLFTLIREGSGDSFAGELHIIDQRAVVTAVS